MDDLTIAPDQSNAASREAAIERIANFVQEFGEAHLTLACHAAFPLVLTPDLVYRIWANFIPQVPWTAVADLLLSRLCREVGYELYEIDATIRNTLLKELREDERFGQQRLNDLADFLTEYVADQLESDDPEVSNLTQAQRWTALAYTRPVEAARKLALALSESIGKNDAELIRVASLVETLSEPLAAFEVLITYATGIASWTRGEIKKAATMLGDLPIQQEQVQALETNLPVPAPLLREIKNIKGQSSEPPPSPLVTIDQIEQLTNLTVNFIIEKLEQLAELLKRVDVITRLSETGVLELKAGNQHLSLTPNLLDAFKLLALTVDVVASARHRAYAAWLAVRRPTRPIQRVAAREYYVPLSGSVSLEKDLLPLHFSERRIVGEGPQRQIERVHLTDVAEAVDKYPAFVLLGAPGSGKSTVLQRLALTTAQAFLTETGRRLPLLITLAAYNWQRSSPLEYVRRICQTMLADDFVDLARSGHILLLTDGFNEMLRLSNLSDHRRRANAWEHFIAEYFSEIGSDSSRVIITSRTADYDQPLGLPIVEIEPLNEEQIASFLRAYLGDEAGNALAAIKRLDLLGQACTPYSLSILAQLYDPAGGDLPPNRGRLFARYARFLLEGERQAGYDWYELDATLAALAELAYTLQQRGENVALTAAEIQALLPTEVMVPGQKQTIAIPIEAVLNIASNVGIITTASGVEGVYKFNHQTVQEQFAAQHLLARWQIGNDLTVLWHSPRTHREMPSPEIGEWDPLPPPPATGWEQTTILAAGMLDKPDSFVRTVLSVNPPLAGRCIIEGNSQVASSTLDAVRQALVADLSNPTLHRRVRLQAGRILGVIGDPRFVPKMIGKVEMISPDLV